MGCEGRDGTSSSGKGMGTLADEQLERRATTDDGVWRWMHGVVLSCPCWVLGLVQRSSGLALALAGKAG